MPSDYDFLDLILRVYFYVSIEVESIELLGSNQMYMQNRRRVIGKHCSYTSVR